TSSSETPSAEAIASVICRMISGSRPSEKLGTHSISFCITHATLDRIYMINRIARAERCLGEGAEAVIPGRQAASLRSPSKRPAACNLIYSLRPRLRAKGNVDLVLRGKINRLGITGIGVTQNGHSRIAGEHAFEATPGSLASIGHHYHASVLRIADADTATVMN